MAMCNAWGQHLVLDLSGCPKNLLTDGDNIKKWSKELVSAIDMTAYGEPLLEHFANGNENPSSMEISKRNKQPRVYKGGSWADAAYWCSPGTRRFWAQDSSSSTIGFRCAMIQAGRNY
jgi:formylglycine-generating enzyme required for sulfatase activity